MTCQILNDMLTHKYIEIQDINLIIFDECHQAVDDHPMRLIMKHFDVSCEEQPRILGNFSISKYCRYSHLKLWQITFKKSVFKELWSIFAPLSHFVCNRLG